MAQHEHHDHGQQQDEPIARPRVFLDKTPRIVWYQLDRLSNERLLLVERSTEDAKFIPVWEAILLRPGISDQHKEEAVAALVELNESSGVAVLLDALGRLTGTAREQQRAGRQLTALLLALPADTLAEMRGQLGEAITSDNALVTRAAFAALVAAGGRDEAWSRAAESEQRQVAYLAAIPLLPDATLRGDLRDTVMASLDEKHSARVRRAAIQALAFVPSQVEDNFRAAARLIEMPQLETAVIRTLLRIPPEQRPADAAQRLVAWLVEKVEATPAAERTSDAMLDAVQLADQLLAALRVDTARRFRSRLRDAVVRVVRIRTVEEEMRYDTPYFAVEAGRPVQIVLQNEDLMPHNLVITAPGALRDVADLAATLAPDQGHQGKQYVPNSELVLFATQMVQAGQQQRLTFTAPSEPGEYPYVCTFPRHWMRMNGVMVVVDDLDAWLQDPQEPADPLGNSRALVQNWTFEDLRGELAAGLQGRTTEIGQRLFTEATCAQCHKMKGQGGAVGPELTDVLQRWKGNREGILREVLDPSYKVDAQYAVQVIFLQDGRVVSGVVTAEDKTAVTVVSNPEAPQPQRIPRSDIDEIQKTSTSLMPKGLLDRYTQDEIFEILAYLAGGQQDTEPHESHE